MKTVIDNSSANTSSYVPSLSIHSSRAKGIFTSGVNGQGGPRQQNTMKLYRNLEITLNYINSKCHDHVLKERVKLTLGLQSLNIRAATNVLTIDENVRDGTLASDLMEVVLDRRTVSNIIKLNDGSLGTVLLQDDILGAVAVRAVSLRGNEDVVILNALVDLLLLLGGKGHFWRKKEVIDSLHGGRGQIYIGTPSNMDMGMG